MVNIDMLITNFELSSQKFGHPPTLPSMRPGYNRA